MPWNPNDVLTESSGDPPLTRMRQLRQATRLAHERVEASLSLLEPGLTRGRYARVLEAFYGFYAPLEPLVFAAAEAHEATVALELCAKVPLLVTDLRALGSTQADVDALPRCAELPRVDSASHTVGILYVFEGATLGGQIIRRQLQSSATLDGDGALAFFTGYGDRTRAMWTRFGDRVDRAPSIDTEAAVGAAIETFEMLARWFASAMGAS
jgi:heme oxygenase